MDADDLDELDRAILDFLKENRESGVPWGIATPAVVKAALEDRWDEETVPTRQTINNRMRLMEAGEHLENRYGKGMYVFRNDPREE